MSRIVRSGLVVFALLLSMFVMPVAAGAASGDGNSAAAQMCQQGGDANLVGVSGGQVVTFKNVGDCVSFASQGGQLVLRSAAQPCLNGGYANLVRIENNTTFASQAECVAYVGNGGKPVAKSTATLVVRFLYYSGPSAFVVQIEGNDLMPNSPVTLRRTALDGFTDSTQYATTTSGGRTFSFTGFPCGAFQSISFSSLTPTGAIITAAVPIAC